MSTEPALPVDGMTLRDYFAIRFAAEYFRFKLDNNDYFADRTERANSIITYAAYELADAMMKEGGKV